MTKTATLQSRKLKAGLNRRQLGWIGVDIGTGALKLAQMERIGSRMHLSGGVVIPFGKTREINKENLSDGFLKKVIRIATEDGLCFQGKKAACVISMSSTELRTIDLPNGTDDELRSMIHQELESDTNPDSEELEEQEFEFWNTGISSGKNAEEHQAPSLYNVISISRALAEHVAENLLTARLRCQQLDGLPFALARAAQMASGDQFNVEPVAALDWGHSNTTFSLSVSGLPVFTRSLKHCSIGMMKTRLIDGLGLTDLECRQLLSTYGIPLEVDPTSPIRDVQRLIRNLVSEPLSHFFSELEKTMAYLKRHHSEIFPQRLWLLGGGSTLKHLPEALSEKLGIPAQTWGLLTKKSKINTVPTETMGMLGPAAALSALAWQL